MTGEAIQDRYDPDNPCFGCGPDNPKGLQIKSRPRDDGVLGLVAAFQGRDHHAGSAGVLGGGIQATLVDCHGIWTAYHWHEQERPDAGMREYVTAELHLEYRRPVPLHDEVTLRSSVEEVQGRRVHARVELFRGDGEVATVGTVVCHGLDVESGPPSDRK